MSNTPLSSEAVGLDQYLAIVVRRRWVVILCFVGVVSATLAASWLMAPVYQATVTIKIDARELSIGSELLRPVDPFGRTRTSFIDAEVQILRSRTIAENVVSRLNLDWKVDELPEGVSLSLSPTRDDSTRLEDYRLVFYDDQGNYSVFDADGQMIGQGTADRLFRAQGVAFTLSDVRAQRGDEIRFSTTDFRSAVARLRGRTSIVPVKSTHIINVTVQGDTPNRAAAAANTIVEMYSAQSLQRSTGQAVSTRVFLDEQLQNLQEELERSERALENYKTESGVITLDDEVQASLERLTEVELQKAHVEAERVEAESLLNRIEDSDPAGGNGLLISTSGIGNPLIVGLSATLANLDIERASLEQVFTPKHPSVVSIRSRIDEARRKLVAEVSGAISALRERESALGGIIRRYEGDLKNLPEIELNLVSLLRTSRVNEGIYTFLLQKLEETRIAEASEVGNVFIIDSAIPPTAPIKPNTRLNAILGAIVGLGLGVGLAFFVERLDTSIKTADDVTNQLGIPVFGVIPELQTNGTQTALLGSEPSGASGARPAIMTIATGLMALEAYRSLRTNIQYADPDQNAKTILVTSAVPKEGKTTTVANLAVSLAHIEGQVLLVGADMRKPELHTAFGVPKEPGLSEILTGRADWHSTLQPSGFEGLKIISSGKQPPNPADILGSHRMTAFLEAIKAQFDIILFDSPPTLGFADAAVLGNRLDGAFIVVRAGKTTPQMVAHVKTALENVNTKILGVILNRISSDGDGYGHYLNDDYYRDYTTS